MKKKEIIRKIKFTLFSISAGIIEILVLTILNKLTDWEYWATYLPALVLSVLWNFTLNREYTFKSNNNISIAMIKVFIFYLFFTPFSTILGNFLAEKLLWNDFLVTGINMLLNFILEYLYDEYIVFRGSIDTKEKKNEG